MKFSEGEKLKFRIGARFLRRAGHKFTNGNFYDSVNEAFCRMEESEKAEIMELIDWIVSYEMEEQASAPAEAPPQSKNQFSKKDLGASRRLS